MALDHMDTTQSSDCEPTWGIGCLIPVRWMSDPNRNRGNIVLPKGTRTRFTWEFYKQLVVQLRHRGLKLGA